MSHSEGVMSQLIFVIFLVIIVIFRFRLNSHKLIFCTGASAFHSDQALFGQLLKVAGSGWFGYLSKFLVDGVCQRALRNKIFYGNCLPVGEDILIQALL